MSGIVIDSFAGGGGASLGIAWALGKAPDIAINHDKDAIAMHAANHPSTSHVLEDVWKADLRKLVAKRKVALLWLSPDCKHFSRAKGAKPVEKKIRSLAWIAIKWAQQVKPAVIVLENVREFEDWGPLVPVFECRNCDWTGTEGQATLCRVRRKCPRCDSMKLKQTTRQLPDPFKKGLTFKRFVGELIFWPDATHGAPEKLLPGQKPYRTAAECIDWSVECPSIFTRKRPLVDKTMRRIALGIKRYVLDNPNPFIVGIAHGDDARSGDRTRSIHAPLGTVTRSNNEAVVVPIVSKYHGQKSESDSRCSELSKPFPTLDTQPRFALISPTMVAITHDGERNAIDPNGPLPTITTAHRGEIGLVAATMVRQFGESSAVDVAQPAPTTTAGGGGKTALVSAFLAKHFGGMVGVEATTPLPTTTQKGCQTQVVAANLIHLNHGEKQWSSVEEPLRTITASGQHAALVYAFLTKYFGTAIGSNLLEPTPTVTAKDRFGLVTVTVAGEQYVIVDIGMRMLTPRELARAQGFPDTYELTGTKTSQVARIGNSVCPQVAHAIVQANRPTTDRRMSRLSKKGCLNG